MHLNKALLIKLACLALAALLLPGCPGDKQKQATGKQSVPIQQGGVVALPLETEVRDLLGGGYDPANPRLFALTRAIALPLVQCSKEGEYSPSIATHFDHDGYRSWSFDLQQVEGLDEAHQPGKAFDTRLRQLLRGEDCPLKSQIADLIAGAEDYMLGTAENIAGIELRGNQLSISLNRDYAQFPAWLSQPGLALLNTYEITKDAASAEGGIHGFGPFALTEVGFDRLVLTPNPQSLGGHPMLERLEFVCQPDRAIQLELYGNGELLAANVPADAVPGLGDTFSEDETVKLETASTVHGYFNLGHFPWQDSNFQSKLGLRQGVNWALNREYLETLTEGEITAWPHFFPEPLSGYCAPGLISKPTFPLSERLDEAGAAMRSADHWDGDHLIPGMDLSYVEDDNLRLLAREVLTYWKDIGVKMRPHGTKLDDIRTRVGMGTHEIILQNFRPAWPGPDGSAYPLLYSGLMGLGGNWSSFNEASIDTIIENCQASDDHAYRDREFENLSTELEDKALMVFIGYNSPTLLVSTELAGYSLGPYDYDASLPAQDFSKLGLSAMRTVTRVNP